MDKISKHGDGYGFMDIMVGSKLRDLRKENKLSLRNLADMSRLNINTLSLIENAKISPSISTLHRLASSLNVNISAFFEDAITASPLIITQNKKRPFIQADGAKMENLTDNFFKDSLQSYRVTLDPGFDSGDQRIHHIGFELVYCVEGQISYSVDEDEVVLNPGDSLFFDATKYHSWRNRAQSPSMFLLVIRPDDRKEQFNHILVGEKP